MSDSHVAIPERYNVFLQDLSKDYIQLTFMGYTRNISEARTMCQTLQEADHKECDAGRHTYLFRCSRLQGE